MPHWGTSGFGQHAPGVGEGHSGIAERLYKPDGTHRGAVFCSGNIGTYLDFITTVSAGAAVTKPVADAGFPVVSSSFISTETWGNAVNLTRIGQLWSFMQTKFGLASDKFYGIGSSKGCTSLLNYAKANPTKVAGLALLVPAVDIHDIYDNDRGNAGAAAAIAACYDAGRPPDASNPALNTGSFAGIPIKLWYSTSDPVCVPATVAAFAAATGAETQAIGAVGHDASPVDPQQVVDFLLAH